MSEYSWSDFEIYPEATSWGPEPIYTLKNDPEMGSFNREEVENIIKFGFGWYVDDYRNGGRIGFSQGNNVEFEVWKFFFMEKLGMPEDEAEKATEQELYGPDSAKLRDSKNGIGSMMASMDNDSEPNAEIIEPGFDRGGQEELLREIETQGGLRTASTQDEIADAYALYDSVKEQGYEGSFEEFIQMMMIEANKGQSMRGAEGLASLRA